MGVLNDYFRAPDDETAAAVGDRLGGPLVDEGPSEPALDGVDAKGIDATVVLGKLVAAIRHTDWEVNIVGSTRVYPSGPAPTRETMATFPPESPWFSGPWIERLSDAVRDDLAAIRPEQVDVLAAQWARIEEFGGHWEPVLVGHVIAQLAALAGRAQADGDHLYCWTSL
jgi:hypothetical protein